MSALLTTSSGTMRPGEVPRSLGMVQETSTHFPAVPTLGSSIHPAHTSFTAPSIRREWSALSWCSSPELKKRFAIQILGRANAERSWGAWHDVDGAPWLACGRAVQQQRYEHVLPMQRAMRRNVRNRLVPGAVIPIP